mmetsp:Transcript_27737/g.63791  ORF Transcript_27737/g.63791 Transcript_27737/m.63791 type:complete len:230 (-) Transcript_27737:658-1347(-)
MATAAGGWEGGESWSPGEVRETSGSPGEVRERSGSPVGSPASSFMRGVSLPNSMRESGGPGPAAEFEMGSSLSGSFEEGRPDFIGPASGRDQGTVELLRINLGAVWVTGACARRKRALVDSSRCSVAASRSSALRNRFRRASSLSFASCPFSIAALSASPPACRLNMRTSPTVTFSQDSKRAKHSRSRRPRSEQCTSACVHSVFAATAHATRTASALSPSSFEANVREG